MLAAVGGGALAGVPLERIAAAVRTFKAVEHRLEFVRGVDGIGFITIRKPPAWTPRTKALDAFDGNLWVILGGKDKGSDYTVLRDRLHREGARGPADRRGGGEDRAQLEGARRWCDSGTLERAVAEAWANAQPGDTVLLAPACASFDQFQSLRASRRGLQRAGEAAGGIMAQRLKTDWILFTTVLLMVLFGAVMIYSASSVMARDPHGIELAISCCGS